MIIGGYYNQIADVVKEGNYDQARLLLKQAEDFDGVSGGKDSIRLAMLGLELTLAESAKRIRSTPRK